MIRLAITGTPCTGKTSLADELSLLLGAKVIHLSSFIKEKALADSFDTERDCLVVDPKKLTSALAPYLEKPKRPIIVDGHLSHALPSALFDACIITHCDLSVLKTRLEARGYSNDKVRENLDAEILDVCGVDAKEAGFSPLIIDTSRSSPKALAEKAFKRLASLS